MKISDYLRLAFLVAILIGGGGFAAVWMVIWLARSDYLTAALCLGASVWLFSALFHLAYPLSETVRPRVEYGPEGTTVHPQRYADLIFIICLVAGVLTAASFLIFAQLDMVAFSPSNTSRIILPAGCVVYVVYGVPALYRTFKYRDGKHLRLDPHGVEVWDGGQWNSFARGQWEDIDHILDHPLKGKKSFTEVIVFVLTTNRSAKLDTGNVTSDSHTLREWVRFYWQHPEYRDELTDERALQRIEEGKFTVG